MASYPTLLTTQASSYSTESGIATQRATNGTLRARTFFPGDKRNFDLHHFLSAAERDALLTFYAANRLLDVDYTDPSTGTTHTVRFAEAPQSTPLPPWWEVRVQLREV